MKMLLRTFLVGLYALLAASCSESGSDSKSELSESEKAEISAEGAAVAKSLMMTLSTQLKSAMESGGPEAAMGVCASVAQPMTGSVSEQHEKISVSRVSLKNRNPKNAPDPVDSEILENWQAIADAGESLPESEIRFDAETGQAVFYKPIQIQAVCLNCHGDKEALKPGVTAVLNEKYPDDKATGYKEGDLRGAFRVVFEPGSKPLSHTE